VVTMRREAIRFALKETLTGDEQEGADLPAK
jgi:hypothetical protein